jgi:hypothetical protein
VAGDQLVVGPASAVGLADRELVGVGERQEPFGHRPPDHLGLEAGLLEGPDGPNDGMRIRRVRAAGPGLDEAGRDHPTHELNRRPGRRRHVQFGSIGHGGSLEHAGQRTPRQQATGSDAAGVSRRGRGRLRG